MTTRRTILKTGTVTAAGLSVGIFPGPAKAAPPTSTTPDVARLQAALDQFAAVGAATGVLAEVRDISGWAWRGSAGVAELGTSRRVPTNGRFRVGSVTKSFVATVVLQLVGERRMSLDDPLARWYPGIVPNADRITVRHLLQHTSGIFNYTDRLFELYPTIDDILRIRYRHWTPAEIMAIIDGQPALFEPGTEWSYSNTNYILLALIIKRVTGRDYASEVDRRILRPLRLTAADVPGDNPFIKGPHSHGYEPALRGEVVEPVDVTVFNPSVAWAAGEMTSTTTDLNRFFGALMSGRLLRPAQLAEMRTSFRDAEYGLGLQSFQLPCGRLWGHTGGIFGYITLSASTEDGRRQLSLSINPWIEGDPNPPLLDLALAAFCDPSEAARAAVSAAPRLLSRW